ncbi:putative C-type lectin domain family 20 member A [Cetorhinus maximus]
MQNPPRAVPMETNRPYQQASRQPDANSQGSISGRSLKLNRPQPITNGNRVYFLIEDEKTWSKAWSHCRNHYTNLASVRNAQEAKIISSLPHEPHWIGLYNDGLSGWMWTNGDKYSFKKWALWHPYSFNSTLPMCGSMLDSEWHEADCDFPFAFVCYKEVKANSEVRHASKSRQPARTEHPPPSKEVADYPTKLSADLTSKRTYHKVLLEKTWSDARDYCLVHHTDLLSIRSNQESSDTSSLFEEIKLGWCGLYNNQKLANGWKWANGDPVSYTNWKSGSPYRFKIMSSACVYIQGGKWSDAPCRFLFPFVCYTGKVIKARGEKSWVLVLCLVPGPFILPPLTAL